MVNMTFIIFFFQVHMLISLSLVTFWIS